MTSNRGFSPPNCGVIIKHFFQSAQIIIGGWLEAIKDSPQDVPNMNCHKCDELTRAGKGVNVDQTILLLAD